MLQRRQNEVSSSLQRLGLSASEAEIYLALVRNGALGATALADAAGLPRTAVYPVLSSLTKKGVIEVGAGYGGRFTAIRPDDAFPSLIARERAELLERERLAEQDLLQRKRLADDLATQIKSLAEPAANNGEVELIQVLRDPRVCAERFNRLQLEAKREIHIFVKSPILNPSYSNPAQEKAMRRGVRVRALYERAILDAPEIKPYLSKWVAAGEDARVHDGDLPHKLAIFDRQNILIPLVPPGGRLGKILFIRHPQLAASLGMLFEFLWERAKPIALHGRKKIAKAGKPIRRKGKQILGPNSNR